MVIKLQTHSLDSQPGQWVKLTDLVEHLFGAESLLSTALLVATWIFLLSIEHATTVDSGGNPLVDKLPDGNSLVPDDAARRVITAVEHGVCYVDRKPHHHLSDEDQCPAGTLLCREVDGDFMAVIGYSVDGLPVNTESKPSTPENILRLAQRLKWLSDAESQLVQPPIESVVLCTLQDVRKARAAAQKNCSNQVESEFKARRWQNAKFLFSALLASGYLSLHNSERVADCHYHLHEDRQALEFFRQGYYQVRRENERLQEQLRSLQNNSR